MYIYSSSSPHELEQPLYKGALGLSLGYLTIHFRSLAPEGPAELLLVATVATVITLVSRLPCAGRLVIEIEMVALLRLWVAILVSLALTLAKR